MLSERCGTLGKSVPSFYFILPLLKLTLRRVVWYPLDQAQAKNEHHDNHFQYLQTILLAESKSNRKKYFFNSNSEIDNV